MRIESLHLAGVGPFEDTTIEFPAGGNPELADVYLLVGENGCGKTTALHVMAALLSPVATEELKVTTRFAAPTAAATMRAGDSSWFAHKGGTEIGTVLAASRGVRFSHFSGHDRGWDRWFDGLSEQAPTLSWLALAYAGQRTISSVLVKSLQELGTFPLEQSLGFYNSTDAQQLAQWIANQQFKRLKAESAGLRERAEQIGDSISRIENAVREIIGADFRFHTAVDDLNVRAQLNGAVIEFGLLPEGVKSIVSWIADLLMRMDRVKWVGDLPIHQREFLLLLDEIDIHLHPAWQRKLLPVVQKLFPKAQIIASTHSPFVVASLADGAVIELRLDEKGRSTAQKPVRAPLRMSYSTTLRALFGVASDFDLATETAFNALQTAGERVLRGEPGASDEFERLASDLETRGEEVSQLVQFERRQIARARRPSGS